MRILIIEDDEALASIMRGVFDPIADSCKTVGELIQATEAMNNEKFDIVTMDVNLKQTKGEETLQGIKKLKKINPDTILIVYTGIAGKEIEEAAMEAGADGFISKAEAATSPGGFIGAFLSVVKSLRSSPKYEKSVNLLELLVNRIAAKYRTV